MPSVRRTRRTGPAQPEPVEVATPESLWGRLHDAQVLIARRGEQLEEARERRARLVLQAVGAGMTYREIARACGVTATTVQHIINKAEEHD